MESQLVDRIYESAFAPEYWPGVLQELASIARARFGMLCISGDKTHRCTLSRCDEADFFRDLAQSGYLANSRRVQRLIAARHPGFMRGIDHADIRGLTPDEIRAVGAKDKLYADILFPRGLGPAAATHFDLPTNDRIIVSLERDWERGPVEDEAIGRLDDLRPHLARSALMAARLQLERARAASETLAALGLAAVVLDENGKALFVNRLMEGLSGFLRWLARDRVCFADRAADRLLRDAMASTNARNPGPSSFPVRGARGEATLIAHVIPVRRSARDIFTRCATALVLTPVSRPQAPPAELVQSLFDLTPAEARVARGLASGQTVEDIACSDGVSSNTVRSQVRRVLEKTGCGRQTDVVALLTAIALPHAESAIAHETLGA